MARMASRCRAGPYKFVKSEWQPGHQVVYERFADYVPRNEAPSGAAGGSAPTSTA